MVIVDPHGHPLPLSRAARGAAGPTGSWRTKKPVIDESRCVGCLLCWFFCPENTIDVVEVNGKSMPRIDYEYCKGCGVCAQVCPTKTISMVEEVG
ncbi:MAG TPA: 4Fe-4S dicluster domain-containing protein [Pyrodictium sp.]|nr:4Fe-4S dicluster domain-containing protein [Pyrodictium sp.]